MTKLCEICDRPLTGRQRKTCSDECHREWTKERGRTRYRETRPPRFCVVCGKLLTYAQAKLCSDRECHREYRHRRYLNNLGKEKKHSRERYQTLKKKALERLVQIYNLEELVCHIEGCYVDDIDLLDFGHPLGNGREHRKETGQSTAMMARWILGATDEEIKRWVVKPECCMCNHFHRRKGRYPTPEERMKWDSEHY